MAKKPKETAMPAAPSIDMKWDPDSREPWHLEFEKEPVNEDRWSCSVAAAVQAEVQDEEYIQIYRKCVATDLRGAIKIITMADIINLLKGTNAVRQSLEKDNKKAKGNKKEKAKVNEKEETKTNQNPPNPANPPKKSEPEHRIVELARKYATYTENECILPPRLMAALIKLLLLNLKQEDIRKKKIALAEEKRIREYNLKLKFLSSINYEMKEKPELSTKPRNIASNILGMQNPIDDEPPGGPDLYIMLIDFYNPLYFTELVNINVPFLALMQIAGIRDPSVKSSFSLARPSEFMSKSYINYKKGNLVANFWNSLSSGSDNLGDPNIFKNILFIEFQVRPLKNTENKIVHNLVFDDLSWLLYSTYTIYRQHLNYLKEMSVQRLFMSLEPLDLFRCDVYNKLCDALVTGEPNTVLFILYAIIEQVVVGVPFTDNVALEYEFSSNDIFKVEELTDSSTDSATDSSVAKKMTVVTPCTECRSKVTENISDICYKLKNPADDSISVNRAGSDTTQRKSSCPGEISTKSLFSITTRFKSKTSSSKKYEICETLIDQVLSEKKSEKEMRQDKKWKNPLLKLYGDYVGLDTFHCDKRLIDPSTIFERFLKNTDVTHLWDKYPKLSPEKRAFYNFQFNSLWKKTNHSPEILKFKIFFALSVKLIAVLNSEVYQGEDDNVSDVFGSVLKERLKKISIRAYQAASSVASKSKANVQSYYKFTRVTVGKIRKEPRKATFLVQNEDVEDEEEEDEPIRSLVKDTVFHQNAVSHFNIFLTVHRSSNTCYPYPIKSSGDTPNNSIPSHNQVDQESIKLFNILDSVEISNIPEYNFLANKEEYLEHISKMKYFETLDPNRMVQRLMEAQEMYNTIQCLYFPPTDSLILIMHNDADYRGLFFTLGYGKLRTPVTLKDFYKYVYPGISDWISKEENEFNKFIQEVKKKELDSEEKKNEHYLTHLKNKFRKLNEEEAAKFIEEIQKSLDIVQEVDVSTQELAKKYKPPSSNKLSFPGINLADFQVESHKNVQEYFSRDGTEINLSLDRWIHETDRLLTLKIKKSKLKLIYYSWLERPKMNSSFILRTSSDIMFHFYKQEADEMTLREKGIYPFFYNIRVSWPTGLLIQSVPHPTLGVYVKQNYIKIYRKDWDIKEEECRCYLKNGQVLIFKENGSVDILCASGTIIFLQEFGKTTGDNFSTYVTQKYAFITATGEVWEKLSKGPCRKKRKLISTYKIYMGTDPITLETYYRRDDGVSFMLWPNAKLVTSFPDGTKITSIPDFDDDEIYIEWTEEEASLFGSEKFKTPRTGNNFFPYSDEEREIIIPDDGFISISISYLLEHPKYASVTYKTKEKFVLVGMPNDVSVKVYTQGCYKVKQNSETLNVINDKTEFFTDCLTCHDKSIVTLKFDYDSNLCKFVDFFRQMIMITPSGELIYKDEIKEDIKISKSKIQANENASKITFSCNHTKSVTHKQKCFALERDLSGIELIGTESLANYCYDLSEDTYFDLDSKDPKDALLSHTFCAPYSRVGYEKWVMEYEDPNDTLPTNLKKKDLKEQGKKENLNKLYQHPFPKKHEWDLSINRQVVTKIKINMPKIIIARTIKTISDKPLSIITDLQSYVKEYQTKARRYYEKYKTFKMPPSETSEADNFNMRLKNISLAIKSSTLSHSQYSSLPLTEKDIHDNEHRLNFNELIKDHFENENSTLPKCKYIPRSLPRKSFFSDLPENEDFPPLEA